MMSQVDVSLENEGKGHEKMGGQVYLEKKVMHLVLTG